MSNQNAPVPPEVEAARKLAKELRGKERESVEEQMKLLIQGKDEETTQGPWIQINPMCRVLLEMPEEDALWLREKLNKEDHMVDVVDEDQETRPIQIHIREILIIP